MTDTILVTGPDLADAARDLIAASGFETVHTPPYADSDVIAGLMQQTGAVGIVSRMGRIDAGVMDAASSLRVISKHGAGVDNIDLAAAAARGIPVLVASGANAVSVAEHSIALMLACVKQLLPLDAGLRAERWDKPGFLGRELAGATIGLVGMGAIARATGRMVQGLGLTVIAYDPYAPDAAFAGIRAERFDTLEALAERSDVLSLHCPLNDETRGLVGAEILGRMPRGSYIVNTARGGLIDEAALVEAVRSGQIAGAGLDTFAQEPPPAGHPYFDEARIVLTPHIAGVTQQAGARVGVEAVRGILQFLRGETVPAERIANRHLLAAQGAQTA